MIAEEQLAEANGLVARFYQADRNGNRLPYETRLAIQMRLLTIGVKLSHPVEPPDPTAPEGGSTAALKAA